MSVGLTDKEKELFEAVRGCEKVTRGNMRKLNEIYNRVNGLSYIYCNCDAASRKVFFDLM